MRARASSALCAARAGCKELLPYRLAASRRNATTVGVPDFECVDFLGRNHAEALRRRVKKSPQIQLICIHKPGGVWRKHPALKRSPVVDYMALCVRPHQHRIPEALLLRADQVIE